MMNFKPMRGRSYVKHRHIVACLLATALCAGPAMAQELTGTLKNIKDTGAITLGFRELVHSLLLSR